MKQSSDGFLYPEIDDKLCTNCGLCKSVCSVDVQQSKCGATTEVYFGYSKNNSVRRKSSSGGLFYEFGKNILERGGVVCAAKCDNDLNVVHDFARNIDELRQFMKSKYIQSDIGNSYRRVKTELENNKLVLFMGTPCQVKGLKLYLRRDYDNLLCGEVVCHGVPSAKVFNKYTKYLHKEAKISKVDFRDKSTGWDDYSIKFEFEDGYLIKQKKSDCLYLMGFINNLFLRNSCYHCDTKIEGSYADFTLGDYWGAEKLCSEIDYKPGVSLLIIHNPQIHRYLTHLDSISLHRVYEQNYKDYNPSIFSPAKYNCNREIFFKRFNDFDFGTLWDYVNTNSKIKKLKMRVFNRM